VRCLHQTCTLRVYNFAKKQKFNFGKIVTVIASNESVSPKSNPNFKDSRPTCVLLHTDRTTFAETGIIDVPYRLRTRVNKLSSSVLFAAKEQKFAVFVFRLQQTNRSCRFLFVVCPFFDEEKTEAIHLQTD
jgi:hypothetical protein